MNGMNGNGREAMIQLNGVDKVYQTERIETLALSDINLSVSRGEFMAIMGPSGCGKSTLLNVMGLLDKPSRGEVAVEGQQVEKFRDRRLSQVRNEKLGFIFQSFHLIPDLTVRDNVELPLLYRNISSGERRKAALEAIDRVGLRSRASHFPGELSGGQQQRVAIARAIVGRPRVLLADEPTGNLDSQMGDEIMSILKELHETEKTTIVMVTHDQRLADQTERIVRLFDGRQVQ